MLPGGAKPVIPTNRKKRQAARIEEGYERRGVGAWSSEMMALATFNELTGGGFLGGLGQRSAAICTSRSAISVGDRM